METTDEPIGEPLIYHYAPNLRSSWHWILPIVPLLLMAFASSHPQNDKSALLVFLPSLVIALLSAIGIHRALQPVRRWRFKIYDDRWEHWDGKVRLITRSWTDFKALETVPDGLRIVHESGTFHLPFTLFAFRLTGPIPICAAFEAHLPKA